MDAVKMCIPGQLLTLRIPGDISVRDFTCWRTGTNTWLNPDLWAGWVFPANGWLRDHTLLVLGTILNHKFLGAVVLDWRNFDSRFIVISETLKSIIMGPGVSAWLLPKYQLPKDKEIEVPRGNSACPNSHSYQEYRWNSPKSLKLVFFTVYSAASHLDRFFSIDISALGFLLSFLYHYPLVAEDICSYLLQRSVFLLWDELQLHLDMADRETWVSWES